MLRVPWRWREPYADNQGTAGPLSPGSLAGREPFKSDKKRQKENSAGLSGEEVLRLGKKPPKALVKDHSRKRTPHEGRVANCGHCDEGEAASAAPEAGPEPAKRLLEALLEAARYAIVGNDLRRALQALQQHLHLLGAPDAERCISGQAIH